MFTARSLRSLETQRTQSSQMQKDSLGPEKKYRLKQTWIALSGKNELVLFFHNGLSICPNVQPLGLPLCGSFKLCKRSTSESLWWRSCRWSLTAECWKLQKDRRFCGEKNHNGQSTMDNGRYLIYSLDIITKHHIIASYNRGDNNAHHN